MTSLSTLYCSGPVHDVNQHREASCAALRRRLDEINARQLGEVNAHLEQALTNFVANARWRFVDAHGERVPEVVANDQPLMWKWVSFKSSFIVNKCILL